MASESANHAQPRLKALPPKDVGGLSGYVRQLAWLHAVPDPDWHKNQGKAERRARVDSITDDALKRLPEVEHGPHLLEWLHDVGPVEQGMNGPQPLSWQEINAWKQAKDVLATGEELSILRQLSKEYVSQYHRSANPHEPPPNRPQRTEQDKAEMTKNIKAALRAAAPKPKKQPA